MLVNKKELADILGKTERTITTLQKNGLPIKNDGKRGTANVYETEEVIDWLIHRELARMVGQHGSPEDAYIYEVEKARLTHHQANIAELDERIKRRELIPVEEVITVEENMIASSRAKLLGLPKKLSPRLLGINDLPQVEAILSGGVREVAEELASHDWSGE